MTQAAFGAGPMAVVRDPRPRSGSADMELVWGKLASLAAGGPGELNLARPEATAAFSRRDSRLKGYTRAEAWMDSQGFSSIIRPVGGHLAAYGPGDLVVHLWAPHLGARAHIRERFGLFGDALARALRAVGIDARVGPVPGEYCAGEFSVNDSGRAKLAGTGQRITKHGYLFSAVVMVEEAGRARSALAGAYKMLDLDFNPETVGCVAESAPGTALDDVREALVGELYRTIPLGAGSPAPPVFSQPLREALAAPIGTSGGSRVQ
ncbi:lipoyl protein ligase domain-containing protein [Sinomonas sp. P47F7]|uniref:lipoyl protein ligase domain-containing protein n=1 Tax=Sinomonas sp. P47F7 TaxID=3410987 RepID=UPI003BF4D222